MDRKLDMFCGKTKKMNWQAMPIGGGRQCNAIMSLIVSCNGKLES